MFNFQKDFHLKHGTDAPTALYQFSAVINLKTTFTQTAPWQYPVFTN